MINFKKEVRDIQRFNQIINILIEEEFGFLLDELKIRYSSKKKRRIRKEIITPQHRLRLTFQRLGPTFIKLGQLLSVRPDLIPKDYIKELEKLQDKVPPFSYEEVRNIIQKEFNKPINKIFLKFEPRAFASASISQVHRAVLKDGSEVAVKIQRPNIKEIMEIDIEIMFFFAKLIQRHIKALMRYRPVDIVHEFAEWTKNELDFRIEEKNARIFCHNFKNSKAVKIPKIYTEYTTSNILVLEYLDGIEINKIDTVKKKWFDIHKVMRNCFEAMLKQVYIDGFFHADPHPGNILILRNNKIGFIDFGIVGYFDKKQKSASTKFLIGMVEHNPDKIIDALLEIGTLSEDIDIEKFKKNISRSIFEVQAGLEIRDLNVSVMIEEVLDDALRYGLKMPTEFVLFGKTIITLEGLALKHIPNFRFVDEIVPFIKKLQRIEFQPKLLMTDFMDNLLKFKGLFSSIPAKIDKTFERIQKGTIKIDIEDTDIKRLAIEIDKSSNRLAYGMLISAFIVSGSLIMRVEAPLIFGLPIISFIFFLCAFVLVIILISSILREKQLEKMR